MSNSKRFHYLVPERAANRGEPQPYLPLRLSNAEGELDTFGLLDTGATVNVLPYMAGLALGFSWEAQQTAVQLTGNLSQAEARAVLVNCSVDGFTTVRLAFAWTRNPNVPLLLGQVNFFMVFDVCFYGAQKIFEVTQAAPQ